MATGERKYGRTAPFHRPGATARAMEGLSFPSLTLPCGAESPSEHKVVELLQDMPANIFVSEYLEKRLSILFKLIFIMFSNNHH